MDFQETPDIDFSEPIAPESEANTCEETPDLQFTEEATEEDDIDDLDEPDQYVESANDDADEQNVNENGTGWQSSLYFPNKTNNRMRLFIFQSMQVPATMQAQKAATRIA